MNREDVSQLRTYCRQHDEDFEIEFEEIGLSVSRINWISNVTNRKFVPLAGTRHEFSSLKTCRIRQEFHRTTLFANIACSVSISHRSVIER